MSEIDYTDDRKCINCEHAKFKEKTRNGIEVYFCGLHREYITIHTLVQFACRGKDFEKRGLK